jgi:hypothetical protein
MNDVLKIKIEKISSRVTQKLKKKCFLEQAMKRDTPTQTGRACVYSTLRYDNLVSSTKRNIGHELQNTESGC